MASSGESIDKVNPPTLEQFISFIKTTNLSKMERFFVSFPVIGGVEKSLMLLCEEAAIPGKTINTRTLRINGMNEYRAESMDFMGDSITLQFLMDAEWKARYAMEYWMDLCVTKPMEGREVNFYSDYAFDITLHALMPAGIPGEKIANWSPTQSDFSLRRGLPKSWQEGNKGLLLNKAINAGKRKIDQITNKAKTQLFGAIAPLANPLIEAFRDTENIVYSIKLIECWPKSINVMPVSWSNPGVHRMNVTFSYKYWVSHVESIDENDDFESKVVGGLNKKVGEFLDKNLGSRIPSVANKLSSLGNDLKAKAISKFGKRFGG
jgi:hypothetical protein